MSKREYRETTSVRGEQKRVIIDVFEKVKTCNITRFVGRHKVSSDGFDLKNLPDFIEQLKIEGYIEITAP